MPPEDQLYSWMITQPAQHAHQLKRAVPASEQRFKEQRSYIGGRNNICRVLSSENIKVVAIWILFPSQWLFEITIEQSTFATDKSIGEPQRTKALVLGYNDWRFINLEVASTTNTPLENQS